MIFEVGIYNKFVREAVRQGEEPPYDLSPDWEDISYEEMTANSESEVRRKAAHKFPSSLGFVIDSVEKPVLFE
jgi:hypothetical protein